MPDSLISFVDPLIIALPVSIAVMAAVLALRRKTPVST
jgi:hypothetical protein